MAVTARRRATAATSFTADCPSATAVGDFVYITGAAVSGIRQVDTVDITVVATMPAIGVVISKATTTRCTVQTGGEITTVAPLTVGKVYYVGADGTPVLVGGFPTLTIGEIAVFQDIGYAVDTNVLVVLPSLKPVVRRG